MLHFDSDYMEGAHPRILQRLNEINFEKISGYGMDPYCQAAKDKIRAACMKSDAEVFFLVGGTQTNATVIDAALASYQGVVAANTGHISVHEAGAIEYTGHKVLEIPHENGKIDAEKLRTVFENYNRDANRDHMVMPGMVYLSHPTEYGTLYTQDELREISIVCRTYGAMLYLDGARLGYGLAAEGTDVTLQTIAAYCDVFYIGGTKVGALFGEAVVIVEPNRMPHFFTMMKQHGALLAKGWLLGVQFDTLFTDHLYLENGRHALEMAALLKEILLDKGYRLHLDTPTNQIFVVMENTKLKELQENVSVGFWEVYNETHTVVRFATSWATTREDVERLREFL